MLYGFYSKFRTLSSSSNILKIGQDLTELQIVKGGNFFETPWKYVILMEIWCMLMWYSLMQQQQRSTGLTSVALSDEELMAVQQQQTQQQPQQIQSSVPSYGDYSTFDTASLGQISTATVSVVDQPDTSHIDELVVPLSTTTAIMSSVSALEQTASSLMYMDPDVSYATSMKDTRGLLNEQTNVCKVRYWCLQLLVVWIRNRKYHHLMLEQTVIHVAFTAIDDAYIVTVKSLVPES